MQASRFFVRENSKSSGRKNAPGRIRTCDPCFRKAMLYPTELRALQPERLPRNRAVATMPDPGTNNQFLFA